MSSQATVTGVAGAGVAVTAVVFADVTRLELGMLAGSPTANVLRLYQGPKSTDIDILADTTFTVTKSGSNYTVTIS